MTEVTPHPECPFSPKSFELLDEFKKSSNKDFYPLHQEELNEYIEKPLHSIYLHVVAQLTGEIIKQLKIDTNTQLKAEKSGLEYNLYHQTSTKRSDARLFINLAPSNNQEADFRFGLFIPNHSDDKPRFIKNVQSSKMKEIVLNNTNMIDNDCTFHYYSNTTISKINFLADWLRLVSRQNSKTKNIQVSTHLKPNEILVNSQEELVLKIKKTLECVYTLFIVGACDSPEKEIKSYLNPKVSKSLSKHYLKKGCDYYDENKFEEAIHQFDLALEETPNCHLTYILRILSEEEVGDIDGVITDYSQLLFIEPQKFNYYDSRGSCYRKQDSFYEAIQDYNQAIQINPEYGLAYYHRGSAYLEFDHKSKAEVTQLYKCLFKSFSFLWLELGIKILTLIIFFKKLDVKQEAIEDLRTALNLFEKEEDVENYEQAQRLLNTIHPDYCEPELLVIYQNICSQKLQISDNILRRYHLALKTRKFVILSGISGTGKTWLTKAYAEAIDAKYLLVPVAPNWTTNEDLLGYFNPIDKEYYHTEFSKFLEQAAEEYEKAKADKHIPKPYHLVLDEMNLARVEYYFAKFLSKIEVRMREEVTQIELAPGKEVLLPPNLYFIGTVNVDETTHSFADKIYDRAQMIELEINRDDLEKYLGDVEFREILLEIWDSLHEIAPFAFRTIDEINTYVREAKLLGVSQNDALDEQLLQKILPKLKGADDRVGNALKTFTEIAEKYKFNLSLAKANKMLATFEQHGFTTYF